MIIVTTIIIYFLTLFLFSRITSKEQSNETFYRGNRNSPWWMVAFGMVGASISGITFVSVPGMVIKSDMTYLQTCLGFIVGYFVVAFVLLPVFYRNNLTTIYSYLKQRLGNRSYKTGAAFFLLSKMTGAAARFFVVCNILQEFVVKPQLGNDGPNDTVTFALTSIVMVMLIWLYTRRGGIKTLVWTDTFQTICMFATLLLIILFVITRLDMSFGEAVSAISNDSHSRIFVFDDFLSKQNFWKQFISGIFIVFVMTGLDQDMMQKHLTCKNLKDAKKDMCTYGFAFVPANLLFLCLGILLLLLAQKEGTAANISAPDSLLPMYAATGNLGQIVLILFSIGIVASSFSSADSAMTALTTSFCIDIMGKSKDESLRKRVHLLVAVFFVVFIILFKVVNSTSVIDAIYILCSYTYGPLLGLFAFALFTKRDVNDKIVPYVAVLSPTLCLLLDNICQKQFNYTFGYELLMLNGLLTFIALWFTGEKRKNKNV